MAKTKYTLRSADSAHPIEDVGFLSESSYKTTKEYHAAVASQTNWQLLRGNSFLAHVTLVSTPEDALDHVHEIAETYHEKDEDQKYGAVAELVMYSNMLRWEKPAFIEKHKYLVRAIDDVMQSVLFDRPSVTDTVSLTQKAKENGEMTLSNEMSEFVAVLKSDIQKRRDKKSPYYSTGAGGVLAPRRTGIVIS